MEVETFRRLATLIQRTEHLCQGLQATWKSHQRASLVKQDAKIRDAHGGKSVGLVLAPHSNRQEIFLMTKTTKALLAGAALAGLFAGTGAAIKASTLFPSLKTSFSAQDQDQGQDKKRRQEGQGKARL
jgi:hypothetical protein